MYIQVGNNQGFTLKDAELMGYVQNFFSEISFDVSEIEQVLGKIGFCFDTRFNAGCNDVITVAVAADHYYVTGNAFSFAEIKERFVSFAKSLSSKEINSADDLFQVFEQHFKG